jgi:hypothetical protein
MFSKQTAYEKWLGIKNHDQPPTLYRLLGLDAFESDADIISNTADSRMGFLRQFQVGDNAQLAEEILNELSHARVVLLNAEKKAAYDARLRQRIAARVVPVGSTNMRMAMPLPSQPGAGSTRPIPDSPKSPGFDLDSLTSEFNPTGPTRLGRHKKKTNSLVWVAAASSVALILIAVIVAISLSGGQDPSSTDASKPVAKQSEPTKTPAHPIASKSTITPSVDKSSGNPAKSAANGPSIQAVEPTTSDPSAVAQQESPDPPSGKPVPSPSDDTPKPVAADAGPKQPALAPVPDAKAQAETTKLIKEVYGHESAAAKTVEQKKALAEKILRSAKENEKDLTSQFVLLRLSRDVATQASDCETAFLAIEEMGRTYQIDALDMKAEALKKCAATATAVDQQESVAAKAAEVSDEAIVKNNFPIAKQLNEVVLGEAKKAKDGSLAKRFSERGAEIIGIANAYETAKKAMATLEKNPTDPDANLIAGKYICFVQGDWQHGLPMLALGSDPTLKTLADEEAKGIASSEEQIKLGDSWWDAAETTKGAEKKPMQRRAEYWYYKTLPGLTALAKDRIEKRLRRVIRITFDSPSALNLFVPMSKERGSCVVQQGNAVLTGGMIYKTYFQSLSSVTIRGGIVSPDQLNFRVAVGPINMILNWEQHNQNIFSNGDKPAPFAATQPRVMIGNAINDIHIKQEGSDVLVLINGKLQYSTKAGLSGTVTVYAGNSTIMVHEIIIEGIPDPDKIVTTTSHNNIN